MPASSGAFAEPVLRAARKISYEGVQGMGGLPTGRTPIGLRSCGLHVYIGIHIGRSLPNSTPHK